MCLSCGCMEPDNQHDDIRHIVMQDLVDAAKASDLTPRAALNNIVTSATEVLEGILESDAWNPK